jgi:hypothetical protein
MFIIHLYLLFYHAKTGMSTAYYRHTLSKEKPAVRVEREGGFHGSTTHAVVRFRNSDEASTYLPNQVCDPDLSPYRDGLLKISLNVQWRILSILSF